MPAALAAVGPPGADVKRALVLGARSEIAQALARRLAAQGWGLVLAARRVEELRPLASDLELTLNCEATLLEFDALQFTQLPRLAARVQEAAGEFELVLLVFGYMGDQEQVRRDPGEMVRTLETNFTGAALTLSHLANYLEDRGSGGIIAVTSVAGDRGRQSNYMYGAAKGGLGLFLQGLRNRLHRAGVHVLTVKPGFVDTPMTEGLEGLFLVASPDRVAGDILRAWEKRRNVVYTPWFWRWIMLVVRVLPERIFKKLSL